MPDQTNSVPAPISREQNCLPGASAFVPSYNHVGFVEQALRSIFAQTLPPIELLVIDDGSTDGSAAVIERTLKDCPFPCEFYVRDNQGLSATLNEALDKIKGEYFAYLGSDDLWLTHFLERRIETLEADPSAVLAYGCLHVIDPDNEIIGAAFDFEAYKHLSTRDRLLYGFAPTSSAIVYRKSFLLNNRWNPGVNLEDYDLFLRLCMQGEFLFDDRIDAAWRLHGTNTSSKYEFMMNELVSAITRNADVLELDPAETRSIISQKKISYIDKYLADHKRRDAIKLFMENLTRFPSKSVMIRKAIKILTPFAISDRRLNYLFDKAFKKTNTYINDNFEVAPVIDPERIKRPVVRPKQHFG